MTNKSDRRAVVVRSFQLPCADAVLLARLAHEADRSWSAEVRRAVTEHLARAGRRTGASA